VSAPVIELRDYQREAIGFVLEAEKRGVRKQLGVAATGLGKAQPISEQVLTPKGWRSIGDIGVGEYVVGSDGQPTRVEGVFPQGVRPIVEVGMSDGVVVRCDEDHLWAVRDKYDVYRERPWRVMTAAEIDASIARRWRIPIAEPPAMMKQDLPVDPYLLGVLLGDGGLSVHGRVLVHTEHELAKSLPLPEPCSISFLHDDGPNGIAGTYIIGGTPGRSPNPVLDAIRLLGLEGSTSRTKFVPQCYLDSTPGDRLGLLQGIMDADGHVRPKDNHVELTTVSLDLAEGVAALVRSLGGTCVIKSKRTSWTYLGEKRYGKAWRLSIAMDECPFRWKAPRWRPRSKYTPTRFIESITPVGAEECVCLLVEADDSLYVTSGYAVTHNTIVFNSLAQQKGVRTLILAHRDELITQAVDKLLMMWPDADVGVVKAQRNEIDHQIVVGSIQTLARRSRLEQIPPDWFELIIVDEAHHATADSYVNALAYFEEGDPLILGVTATPDRGDGKGLDETFDEIVFNYDMLWGIRRGFLSDIKGKRITMEGLDLSKVRISRGDYAEGDVGRALEDADAPNQIAEAYMRYAEGRKTIVFTPTVAVAQAVAIAMRNRGVAAAMVSGQTPLDERRQMLRDFTEDRITVMVNCQVLTEGFDEPSVNCIILARPTKSRALYTQCVGRGTRRHPGKENCLVLDVVGASEEHNLVTIPSLFGIERGDEFEDREQTVAEAIQEQVERQVKLGKLKAAEVELFRKVIDSPLAWVGFVSTLGVRGYTISLGGDGKATVIVEELVRDAGDGSSGDGVGGRGTSADGLDGEVNSLSLWRTSVRSVSEADGQQTRTLISNVDLEMAQGVGEDYVRKHGSASFINRDAAWRTTDDPPSEAQARYARSLGIDMRQPWTKGTISAAIDSAKAAKNLHKPDGGAGSNLATDKQIRYARSLGAVVRADMTKSEVGRLIDAAKKG